MAAIRNTQGNTHLKHVDPKGKISQVFHNSECSIERMPSVSQPNNPSDAMRDTLDTMLKKIRRDAGNSDSEDSSDEWSD